MGASFLFAWEHVWGCFFFFFPEKILQYLKWRNRGNPSPARICPCRPSAGELPGAAQLEGPRAALTAGFAPTRGVFGGAGRAPSPWHRDPAARLPQRRPRPGGRRRAGAGGA